MKRIALGVGVAGLGLLLAGCGVATRAPEAATTGGIQGSIHGGEQPISGVSVQLYAVGTTGDGSAATALLTSPVTSGANGSFTITGDYSCPSSTTLVYLVGTGGNPGLGAGMNNPQLALMAALGQCGTLNAGTFLNVNEITTVAAVYALAPFMTGPGAIGSSTSDAAALASAFTLAAELANVTTGTTPGTGLPTGYTVPVAQVDTIANIVASCINTSGGLSGSSTPCGSFIAMTTPSGITPPTDAITALLNLANHPALNTAALYLLPLPSAPFQPADMVQPSDFSINLITATTMALTPTTGLSYPNTALGSSSSLTATLTNNGPGSIAVNSIAIGGSNPGDFSQTNNCPTTMPTTTSCSIAVAFGPTVEGNRSATLMAATGAANSPLSITLAGFGLYPAISVSPGSLTFASSTVGTPSTAQPVTVTNSGPGLLTLGAISFSGANPGDFSQTNNCPATLAVSAFCTVTVNVTPLNTGARTATMTIASNALAGTSTVTLAGTGTAVVPGTLVASTPALFVANGSTGFVDLTNTGTGAISISSISISSTVPGFGQSNTCGASLAAGASCVVTIAVNGAGAALGTGSLVIANSSSIPQLTVILSTSYYSAVNFGDGVVGTAGPIVPFEAPFIGNIYGYELDLTISGLNGADFTFVGAGAYDSCFSRSGDCGFSAQFNPSGLGSRVALMTGNFGADYVAVGFGVPAGSAQTITATPNTLAFPQTALYASSPSQTMTISNPLGHLLNFSIGTSISKGAADYQVSPVLCSAVSCTETIVFTPQSVGQYGNNGYMSVFDSVTNLTTTFQLSGYGGIPTLAFTPTELDFGSLAVGSTSSSQTFSVSDTGDSPAYLSFAFPVGPTSGGNRSDFSSSGFIATVKTGTPYTSYPYAFAPTGLGNRNATVSVTDSRTGMVVGTYLLTGTGIGTLYASLSAMPASLTFGSTVMGVASPAMAVTITNGGNSAATLGTVSFSGTNASDFSQTTTCGATLAASASCSFSVTFTPGGVGSRSANLLIASNDVLSPLTIPLSGTGNPVPTMTLTPSTLTFYERGVAQPVTLANSGTAPVTISALNLSANYTQTNNCPSTLAAGNSCTISISAATGSVGTFSGTLTVVDSDTVDTQTVTLTSSVAYTAIYNFGSSSVGLAGQTDSFYGGIVTGSAPPNYTFVTYQLVESGPNPGDFPPTNNGSNLCTDREGQPCYLYFEFTPTAPGVRYATVTGNDGSHYLFKGTGVTPVESFSLSPSSLYSFAPTNVGSSRQFTVQVTNTSNPYTTSEAISSAILSTGPSNMGDFSLVNSCGYLSYAGNTVCNIMVTFSPQTTGTRSTILTVTDAYGNQQTLTIQGLGQ